MDAQREMWTCGHVHIGPRAPYTRKSSLDSLSLLFPQVRGAVISSRTVTDFAFVKTQCGHVHIVHIKFIDVSGEAMP